MLRSRTLGALALGAVALAACSDMPAAPADGSSDPLVAASNRNLSSPVITQANRGDEVLPGSGPSFVPYYCPVQPVAAGPGEVSADAPHCPEEPYPPYQPPYQPTPPSFSVSTSISSSSSYGTKYVSLTGTGNYSYASYGSLLVSFRNVGGCGNVPQEYSSSSLSSHNAPFTLSSWRDASYNGTTTYINWGVNASGYAESPEGGWGDRYSSKQLCY